MRDVLVGDVWLCSGQSNQETPIHRLTEMFPEINVSDNNMIRHYKVPTQDVKEELQEEIAGNEYDLSINKYKQVEYKTVEYPPTSEIMANIEALEAEIAKEMAELKKLLNE